MNDLYVQLAEIMEVDEVKPGDVLADFPEWDSLTVLSVIAMLDSKYKLNITAIEMRNFRTAKDLADYVAGRKLN